ncbi:hypothetical protein JCM19301_2878 [Jejuia pallidilutea]|uniref:Uncharacterized protein n=1 Tax=Jejuia pallidilutea TaxID=504487 RepID=A0A090VTC9_9FLAO|nr:hypothetical protein JCM19301_2878 [Jejuia pallidilutea]GAL72193.1 hypothetical protein JCM19302_2110 [Jejuia pallidilutea]
MNLILISFIKLYIVICINMQQFFKKILFFMYSTKYNTSIFG